MGPMRRCGVVTGWVLVALVVAWSAAAGAAPAGGRGSGAGEPPAVAGLPLPDVAASDEVVAHVARVRALLGLPSDGRTVRRLVSGAHPEARWYPTLFSLPLTPGEVPVAMARQRLQERGGEVDRAAMAALGDAYGGSWIEPGGPDGAGRIVVATADPDRALPAALAGDESVAVVAVARSLDELRSETDGIERRLVAAGVASGGIAVDEVANEIVVHVADVDAALGHPGLADVVARPHVRFEEGGRVERQVDKDDALIYLVVEGGQAIGPTDEEVCTSGFAVQSGYGPFILTAGHCGSYVGEPWRQGGRALGEVAVMHPTGSFDGMLITTASVRYNRGRLHITSADYYEPVGFITPGDQINFIVCNTGFASTGMSGDLGAYTRCGAISSRTYDPGTGYNATFRLADYRSLPGDSGAGIYRSTIYGISAEGVHTGCLASAPGVCASNPYRAFYSYLPIIRDHWGLSLSPS